MRRVFLVIALFILLIGLGGCHGHLHSGGFSYSSRAYLPPCPPPPHHVIVNRRHYGHPGRYACPPPGYGRGHHYPRGRRH